MTAIAVAELTGEVIVSETATDDNGYTYTVTHLGDAFKANTAAKEAVVVGMTSLELPDTITKFTGTATFYACKGLESIYLPENLTGDATASQLTNTFYWCSNLEEVEIPAGITRFYGTFRNSAVKTVILTGTAQADFFGGSGTTDARAWLDGTTGITIYYPEGGTAPNRAGSSFTATVETYAEGEVPGGSEPEIDEPEIEEPEEPTPAEAGTTFTDGDFTYKVNTDTETVTLTAIAAAELTGEVIVSETATDDNGYTYTVTQLGDAFKNQGTKTAEITSIELPDTITKFAGTATFYGCSGLEFIDLPENLTGDGNSAVANSLTNTFYYCSSLEEVELPAGIVKCYGTFRNSAVKTVVITGTAQVDFFGGSGTTDARAWLDGTTGITVFYPEGGTAPNRAGNSFTATVQTYVPGTDEPGGPGTEEPDEPEIEEPEEPEGPDPAEIYTYTVLSEEEKTIRITGGQSGVSLSGAVTVPSEINGYTVVSIGDAAFGRGLFRNVTSVVIPDTVKRIESNNAFYDCRNITQITLPEEMEFIGVGAFTGCSALTSIVIPKGVTKLSKTFRRCTSLRTVTIPSSVTEIDAAVFASSDGGTDVMPGITIKCAIGSYAEQYAISKGMNVKYSDGPLYTYTENSDGTITITSLAEDVEIIGTLTVPETFDGKTITGIGAEAFKDREDIVGIALPETVNSIGAEAFAGCVNLTSFEVPEGVTSLEDTFLGCTSLATATIPATVTSISEETFFTNEGQPIPRLVIYCMEESAAEEYARENDIEYVADRVLPDAWDGTVDVSWYDPSESEYFISTPAELAGLRELVNSGTELFYNKTITLTDDINMEGTSWKVGIGYTTSSENERSFNGTFDGNGYRIFNFTYDSTVDDTALDAFVPEVADHKYHAMFGVIGSFGEVKNLGFEDASVTAGSTAEKVVIYVGIISSANKGKITHCYINNASLAGGYWGAWCDHSYGGVSASNTGTIEDVFVKNLDFTGIVAQLNATKKAGIATSSTGTIKDCYVYNPIYDNGNGYYSWNENGEGVSTCPIMFYYDPIVFSNGGTVENVYSSDAFTRNGWTVGTHPYDFAEMTDRMKDAMDMLTFRTIAHAEASLTVEKIDGDLAGINPSLYLEFTQPTSVATVTDETVVLTKGDEVVNSISIVETDVSDYPYSYTIEFGDELEWHNDYEVSVSGVKDLWNREIASITVEFATTDEIVYEEFALYENYGESNERLITSLDGVTGPVTAVIKGLKNNGTATYDAVFSIGALSDGQIVSGANKAVSIGAGETKSSDVFVGNINVGAFTAEDLEMQAVLYKAFNNVVPLISSVNATR